jgi:F-type H+-transporting ATPase subunit epsilon
MLLEIITPETQIFTGEVEAVQLPGLDGSFQVLNGHAPIISALKKGTVKVNLAQAFERGEFTNSLIVNDKTNTKVIRVDIQGGVFEMLNNKITLLAE